MQESRSVKEEKWCSGVLRSAVLRCVVLRCVVFLCVVLSCVVRLVTCCDGASRSTERVDLLTLLT